MEPKRVRTLPKQNAEPLILGGFTTQQKPTSLMFSIFCLINHVNPFFFDDLRLLTTFFTQFQCQVSAFAPMGEGFYDAACWDTGITGRPFFIMSHRQHGLHGLHLAI
jgi:hypothetical protein